VTSIARVPRQVVEDIVGAGGTAVAASLDVTDERSVEDAALEAVGRHGGLDIWVNNAGVYPRGDDHRDRAERVGSRDGRESPGRVSRRAGRRAPHDRPAQRRGDRDDHIRRLVQRLRRGNGAHYVASKHALAGLTKSIAVQLARHRIRALAVAPTLTRTSGVQADRERGHAEMLDAFASRVPAGRMAEPDDIARVVAFAVSDLAGYVSGSTIAVDGANLAR
jgi:NAD(P)-dependent dehydrogenase (short-subunit alcohol dehydrogenase family)